MRCILLRYNCSTKALRYDEGNSTTTGETLRWTREQMFENVANGARSDSTKVAILITNTVTNADLARNESKKLLVSGRCNVLERLLLFWDD